MRCLQPSNTSGFDFYQERKVCVYVFSYILPEVCYCTKQIFVLCELCLSRDILWKIRNSAQPDCQHMFSSMETTSQTKVSGAFLTFLDVICYLSCNTLTFQLTFAFYLDGNSHTLECVVKQQKVVKSNTTQKGFLFFLPILSIPFLQYPVDTQGLATLGQFKNLHPFIHSAYL